MSLGLQLILSTSLVAAPPGCSWAHPGANPYRGDPAQVLADFDLPQATRDALRALMRAHRPTDVATITRDDIVGEHAGYADLREMHSGHGRVCHGEVDRSAWSAQRHERALVYCAGDACVIVPTICNNVSLVSRKPDRVAVLDDSPIDIEPAAGPPAAPPDTASTPPATDTPYGFLPPTGGGDTPGVPPETGNGGGGGGGSNGGGVPIDSLPPGGGDAPCCDDAPPIFPGGPGSPGGPGTPPPIIVPVPEVPTWLLSLAGWLMLRPLLRRARASREKS